MICSTVNKFYLPLSNPQKASILLKDECFTKEVNYEFFSTFKRRAHDCF